MLPSDSPEPGRYKSARVPYFVDVMNAFTDPKIKRLVVKSASQVGKSEVLLNVVGRFAHLDPANILIVQPTLSDAEDFSKSRLEKMIKDSKILTPLFYEKSKSRDPNQTILSKFFKGGRIILVGSNSPSGLASRPIRILLCDEVDRYVPTKEGDAVDLAEKRTSNFWNKKVALFSTPATEGLSRIDAEYMFGTQEEWNHRCPNCAEWHTLSIEAMQIESEAITDAAGNRSVVVKSVKWRCPDCGLEFGEVEMKNAAQKYIAQNPEAIKNGIRSFWVNGFSSAWLKWEEICREWLEAQNNPTREAVVVNTRFGLSYTPAKKIVSEDELMTRLEEYDGEIPTGVLCLTAGVDVQNNRLELSIYGIGANVEIYGIKHDVIFGKATSDTTWRKLDEVLNKTYRFKDGAGIKIARTFIDSGFSTDSVYKYCRGKPNRFAIKGLGGAGVPFIHKIHFIKDKTLPLVILGVNDGKSQFYSRLETIHYGKDGKIIRGFDKTFFKGLTGERLVAKKVGGRLISTYEKISHDVRNEPLDCAVYALGAFLSLVGNQKPEEFFKTCAAALNSNETKKSPVKKAAIKHRELDIWS